MKIYYIGKLYLLSKQGRMDINDSDVRSIINKKHYLGLIDTFKLEPLAKEGDEFNPEIHEAVMFAENENFKENQIQAVLQQGYKLGDTVVRPAMVSVAK